jgi:uncharacterized membrane protein
MPEAFIIIVFSIFLLSYLLSHIPPIQSVVEFTDSGMLQIANLLLLLVILYLLLIGRRGKK